MGGFLDKPIVVKDTQVGQGKIGEHMVRFGVSSMQGWRIEMEDAHVSTFDVTGQANFGLFCVFDGHAGKTAALYAAQHISRILSLEEGFSHAFSTEDTAEASDALGEAMAESFFDLDVAMLDLPKFQDGSDHSGCTAIAVGITETHLIFCNAGDSRAVFVGNGGNVMFATTDHKPDNPTEMERIVKAGGSVSEHRVNGDLAVSRALGDFFYKKVNGVKPGDQPVTCKPDVTIVPRRTDTDQFIVICCDGVWDVMSNQVCADYLMEKMTQGYGLGRCCELLLDHCLELNSHDNMTAVIVAFPAAPKEIGTFRESTPPPPVKVSSPGRPKSSKSLQGEAQEDQ